MEYNIYCDESCHLEHDRSNVMVIGGVWIPKFKRKEICDRIKMIKNSNSINNNYELKWSKVSTLKRSAYLELINYFFDCEDLKFRAIVARNKDKLNFEKYSGDYDTWYYKMYYLMLNRLFNSENQYNIYIDIKDTVSNEKIEALHNIMANSNYDFNKSMIKKIQPIRSEEVEIMQITDILIGALSYLHRDLDSSVTKKQLINLIKLRSNSKLMKSSPVGNDKFNIFIWEPDYYE